MTPSILILRMVTTYRLEEFYVDFKVLNRIPILIPIPILFYMKLLNATSSEINSQ